MPLFVILLVCAGISFALPATAHPKPTVLDPSYQHDAYGTLPQDIIREFRAFTTSFDSKDDNDGNGTADTWGIPEWVAYEIKRYESEDNCIPTQKRPSWFSDDGLVAQGIAPKDASYAYPQSWLNNHPDWYERGHLCMKLIAERLGFDAAYNTHTLLNAVPQREHFNKGIWQDLEYRTGYWAQHYGTVWVVTGPVVMHQTASACIGELNKGEMPVVVPDALFKIVIKDADGPEGGTPPDVLAFVYPQTDPNYLKKPFTAASHKPYLTSVDEIEKLTKLDFLTKLDDATEGSIEAQTATELWPIEKNDKIRACQGHD